MGSCLCNSTPRHRAHTNSFNQHERAKSCQYWKSENTLTVCGYIHELIKEYDLFNYKLPIDITKLIISFYGQKYQIVGIGRNGDGEFGLGHNEEIHEFYILPQFEQLVDSPDDIYFGMGRFLVKNVFNEIYSAGTNVHGAAGIENQNSLTSVNDEEDYDDDTQRIMKFMKLLKSNDDQYIEIVSSGLCSMHTMFVTQNGDVYAAGNNNEGQFGNGKRNKNNYGLDLVGTAESFNYEKICCVFAGQMHTLFLTTAGSVYTCGNNEVGQCGIPIANTGNNEYLAPMRVPNLPSNMDDPVICAKAGSYHNVLLTKNNKVYIFGDRNIGTGSDSTTLDKATLDPHMKNKKIIYVEIGGYFTVCIDNEYRCWLWGNNSFGEIGNGKKEDDVKVPHLFQSMKGCGDCLIDKAYAGGNHTILSVHSKDKRSKETPLISFGNNASCQCSSRIKKECITKPNFLSKQEIGLGDDCNIVRVIATTDSTVILFS